MDGADFDIPGFHVRLVAAFGGCKGIPWIGFSRNNLSPLLILHDAEVEYRVILRRRRRYGDISRVDARNFAGVISIILEFRGSWWSFTGNTDDKHLAAKAFHLLAEKGCPLSEQARALRG